MYCGSVQAVCLAREVCAQQYQSAVSAKATVFLGLTVFRARNGNHLQGPLPENNNSIHNA